MAKKSSKSAAPVVDDETPAPAPTTPAAAPPSEDSVKTGTAGGPNGNWFPVYKVPKHTDPATTPLSYLKDSDHKPGQGNLGLTWNGDPIPVVRTPGQPIMDRRTPGRTVAFYYTLLGAQRYTLHRDHEAGYAAYDAHAKALLARPAGTPAPLSPQPQEMNPPRVTMAHVTPAKLKYPSTTP